MVHVKIYITREYRYNSNNALVSEARARERGRGKREVERANFRNS